MTKFNVPTPEELMEKYECLEDDISPILQIAEDLKSVGQFSAGAAIKVLAAEWYRYQILLKATQKFVNLKNVHEFEDYWPEIEDALRTCGADMGPYDE